MQKNVSPPTPTTKQSEKLKSDTYGDLGIVPSAKVVYHFLYFAAYSLTLLVATVL